MFVLRLVGSIALVAGFLFGFLGLWSCYTAVRIGPTIIGKQIMIDSMQSIAVGSALLSIDQLIQIEWHLTFVWMTVSLTFVFLAKYSKGIVKRNIAGLRI